MGIPQAETKNTRFRLRITAKCWLLVGKAVLFCYNFAYSLVYEQWKWIQSLSASENLFLGGLLQMRRACLLKQHSYNPNLLQRVTVQTKINMFLNCLISLLLFLNVTSKQNTARKCLLHKASKKSMFSILNLMLFQ